MLCLKRRSLLKEIIIMGLFMRMVKGIFVTRDRPFFFRKM